ncbi:lipoyl(octanoyl) transferase LipB [Pseudoroseomonas oryzae]|uniref:Octanoyltransferase n=2 Tax=Teichococcus oryzae TaxID=1608942 RepID=A0A5B2TH42_9PROT|nr:lipoyl(octanoyl) transferase LipB [Pseudoroseomonas oryzae]KAA2213315.1 lipoyl(octanoyl) transferase LipB [Pseudoroseomonas oryzae]
METTTPSTATVADISPSASAPACPRPEWRVADGFTDYPVALEAMRAHAAAIRKEGAAERVWLVEHPPTYTAGTSSTPEGLLDPRFPVFEAGRGGQWTYHGPGQRTAYVMLDLERPHGTVPPRDIRAYVHGLEEWIIRALDRFNVKGERREGRVGIWVDEGGGRENKIAAIGVRVTRWVSWHGIAMNVEPDLTHFGGIVPCGIRQHGVTSLWALGLTPTMEEVDSALKAAWAEVFG